MLGTYEHALTLAKTEFLLCIFIFPKNSAVPHITCANVCHVYIYLAVPVMQQAVAAFHRHLFSKKRILLLSSHYILLEGQDTEYPMSPVTPVKPLVLLPGDDITQPDKPGAPQWI